MMIGQYGTNDVDNFGDLLYPIIWEKVFQGYSSDCTIEAHGFLEDEAPCEAGFSVTSIRRLLNGRKKGIRHLLVGGGDILRTDTDRMAGHYFNLIRQKGGALPVIEKAFGRDFAVRSFQALYFPRGCPGPFLLNAKRYKKLDQIAYVSCGIPFSFEGKQSRQIRECFEQASFVYLRDEFSAEKLRQTGFSGDIHIAPDVVVLLSRFFPRETTRARGKEILAKNGVEEGKKVLCFQAVRKSEQETRQIIDQLGKIKKSLDFEVVLLPIGYCHNDHIYLKGLQKSSEHGLRYIEARSVFDIMSVICASDLFAGTSMHGNITAFSYGVPHVFAPIKVKKIAGLLKILELDPQLQLLDWGGLYRQVLSAMEDGPDFYNENFQRAAEKIDTVIVDLLNSLGLEKQPANFEFAAAGSTTL